MKTQFINKSSGNYWCKFHTIVLLLFLLLNNLTFSAQLPDSTSAQGSIAAVEIDGNKLFYVRGISSFTAADRARIVAERIISLAETKSFIPDSIQIIDEGDRNVISGNGIVIVRLFDFDAEIEEVSRQILSEIVKQKIIKAIKSYRFERSSDLLIKRIIYASIATVLLILILFLFRLLSRRFDIFLEAKVRSRIEMLESQSHRIIQAKQLWTALRGFTRTIKVTLTILLLVFYVQFVLEIFPVTKPIAAEVFSLLIKPLGVMGEAILSELPNIAFLVILIFVVRYFIKLIKLFFTGISQETIVIANFDSDWAWPTFKIVKFVIIVFAIVIAYPYIPGSDSDAFKGISVLLGIMFSIGSSSFISNIVAGYSLTYRRAFKLGDWIKIENNFGEVIDIKPFVTRIRSLKNEEIIIPNSNLINSQVINFSSLSKKNGIILHTTVGIGYETPWRLVEEMLKTAADRTEGLLKDLPPFVLQKSLGDFAVLYEINAYCNNPSIMMKIYSSLHRNILDIFNENNVQIMTPAYEGDPAEPKVVPKEKWYTPLKSDKKLE
ncbi:MAG: mechanosensitive ion channel [Ignavibacteriaceae bacterium]|nr:mechanosensitive ion channel [Ignavibacteriaceae bacterium]